MLCSYSKYYALLILSEYVKNRFFIRKLGKINEDSTAAKEFFLRPQTNRLLDKH